METSNAHAGLSRRNVLAASAAGTVVTAVTVGRAEATMPHAVHASPPSVTLEVNGKTEHLAIGPEVTLLDALLVASAATIGKSGDHAGLQTVGDPSKAFTPVLGPLLGRVVLSVGLVAAAFVARSWR